MPPLQQQIHNVRMAMMQKLPMEETAANEPGEQIIYSPKKLTLAIIDDYSNIHTIRQPQDNPANISHMASHSTSS